ncbi:MAG TPA: peptidylprolyl isomerase [Dictyobacter sp.]|nr:peptidylprolyl isomerase [Dictyobacter sp.]
MKSQTARRSDTNRPARSAQTKNKKHARQTALHFDTRRDGQPLIFGWGSHLTRHQKDIFRRRAVWSVIGLFIVLIVVVFAGYWVNFNIITPNLPITSIAGVSIPQSEYHKLVALRGQMEANKIQGAHGLDSQRDSLKNQATAQQTIVNNAKTQVTKLNKQIAALPANSSQRTSLQQQVTTLQTQENTAQAKYTSYNNQYNTMVNTTIPNEQQLDNQSQIGNDSAQWLQDDVLIKNWLKTQNASVQNQIEPTSAAVTRAMDTFKGNLPTSLSYSQFLSQDNVSNSAVVRMMAIVLRHNNMQTYLASQIKSPSRQVDARAITVATKSEADKIVSQVKGGADFATLAKNQSLDNTTKANGGELGWLVKGQYTNQYGDDISAVVDNWISDPARKAGELSPVLYENGTYHVVQIENIDPSRVVTSATLSSLKTNALTAWLLSEQALPGNKPGSVDQNKLLSTLNMPQSIPSSVPSGATPTVPAVPTSSTPTGMTTGTTDES